MTLRPRSNCRVVRGRESRVSPQRSGTDTVRGSESPARALRRCPPMHSRPLRKFGRYLQIPVHVESIVHGDFERSQLVGGLRPVLQRRVIRVRPGRAGLGTGLVQSVSSSQTCNQCRAGLYAFRGLIRVTRGQRRLTGTSRHPDCSHKSAEHAELVSMHVRQVRTAKVPL